jgi:predicted RNA-binding protein YlxR (DUF448 family)
MRTCMGCMRRDAQDAMARVVSDGRGARIDAGARRAPGRGGYLHWRDECLARFERGGKEREFRSLRRRLGRMERIALTASIRALLVSGAPLE